MSASENESDQIIVINDLLSFVWCKVKLTPKDKLLECIQGFYSKDEALEALKTLITALPKESIKSERKIKDSNPFQSILNLLEISTAYELPMFVCKNLNNVPKLDIIKKEQSRSLIKNKKAFYKEHQRIKSQLNEVFSSLYELKRQFQTISDGENAINNNSCEYEKKESDSDSKNSSVPKDLVYLQNLIDEEKDEEEEGIEENHLSETDDDLISEQRIHLIANRHQRASLKGEKVSSSNPSSPSKQKVIEIECDGKTVVSDLSEYGTESQEEQDGREDSCIYEEKVFDQDSKTFTRSIYRCTTCSFRSKNEVVANNHICDSKFLCSPIASKKENSHFLIVEHEFDENLGNFTLFRCSSCFFCSNDEVTALEHACVKVSFEKKTSAKLKFQPSPNEQQRENKLRVKRKRFYECHSCGSSFKVRRELQRHIETHLEGGHRCPLCTDRFPLEDWQDHVRSCPGNETTSIEDIYCDICDVFYADKRTLSFHKAFHDPSRPFECLECKFRFYTQKTVEDHFRAHKMHRNSNKCPLCDFRSAKQIKIIDHIRCHTGDRPYKCPKCERSCPTYNALKVHLTSHAPTRDFPCNICGKKFKSQSKVASHKKIHTTERPHKCPICGKGFKFGLQMALHHRMHLDIRKHACPQCPYKARTAAILRGHMNTHTNTKPFRCTECEFGANHKSYLNYHMKYYHPKPVTEVEEETD